MPNLRLAVFASGGGTNMQALLDAIDDDLLPATVVGCVSDRSTAGALDRARAHDIPTAVHSPSDYDTPAAFGEALCRVLDDWTTSFIALAGYLKKIPAPVLHAYPNRITNIHPSLLPAFGGPGMYGTRVHRAVLDAGVHWTGVTVHLVNDAYDDGPIVAQQPVPVLPTDTVDALQQRVLAVEHRLYPAVLRQFARGQIQVQDRTVTVTNDSLSHPEPPPHAQSHN
ncbi:phosphoribosylglycinamide formyltransferase [Longimonas halophila]|uniref:Phosphoribosylglycinamide formyltransferase n=1 Tax=Longimonas halophila TaxID=1469170 RepID=A0A2H3NKU4_9BACT|nr:phosphoribosylglycinamide formyltransferase [Longimonas halophila]PEN04962.1 phosphoribosylglycinamide formyltransferase [Longimonas halophila]